MLPQAQKQRHNGWLQKTIMLTHEKSFLMAGTPHQSQVTLWDRIAAKSVDIFLMAILFYAGRILWRPWGVAAALILCALQDGMGNGQSPGKKMLGLRVVHMDTGTACTFQESLLRNLPFCMVTLFATLPWLAWCFWLLGIPIMAFELFLVYSLESRLRLGDILAHTHVTAQPLADLPTEESP